MWHAQCRSHLALLLDISEYNLAHILQELLGKLGVLSALARTFPGAE